MATASCSRPAPANYQSRGICLQRNAMQRYTTAGCAQKFFERFEPCLHKFNAERQKKGRNESGNTRVMVGCENLKVILFGQTMERGIRNPDYPSESREGYLSVVWSELGSGTREGPSADGGGRVGVTLPIVQGLVRTGTSRYVGPSL